MKIKNVHLHILRASGRFEPYVNILEKTLKGAVDKTARHIRLHPIDIIISDDPPHVIPGFGHGARTQNPYTIRISLDPAFPDFEHVIKKEIPRTISHELHHAVRWKTKGYGTTLLERLVSEGLATHFEQEVWGGKPSPWAIALSKQELYNVQRQAQREYAAVSYDHRRWFYGTGDLPRWAGYSLGCHLVGRYLKKHSDQTAAALVNAPAEIIADAKAQ